jgi:hypothetical protein
MQFILQSQSNAAARHEEAMKEFEEFRKGQQKHDRQLKKQSIQLRKLAQVSHDLVEVARLHSARLDRLDGLNP